MSPGDSTRNISTVRINDSGKNIMQMLDESKAIRRRRLLRLNILVAILVLALSFLLTITSTYTTLQERQAAETIYNLVMVGSVLYMVGTWMFCTLTKPFWFPQSNKK